MTALDDGVRQMLEPEASNRPPSTGSLIVTLFGDAILPRGGVLSLAAITRLLEPFGHNSGQIRTALSRLVVDGWFERRRDGRASYYALSPRRAAEFVEAARRVYGIDRRTRQLVFTQALLVEPDVAMRTVIRDRLEAEGFIAAAAGLLLRAVTKTETTLDITPRAGVVFGRIELGATAPEDLVRLARSVWQLDAIAADYNALRETFSLAADAAERLEPPDDRAAFVTRILLLHRYRRVILRDPMLPPAMLPEDWPGEPVADQVATIYRAILAASERWLDAEVVAIGEKLPTPDATLATRFQY